ncbi:MAG TPA: three-Cys-motif partner protein TcmP [Pyrinomonadaceae bacterium]
MPTTPHLFGGDWTTEKLELVRRYLVAYTTALKNRRFRTAYIDAFAGTGRRAPRRRKKSDDSSQVSMFELPPEIYEPETQEFLDGSARIALQVEPRFSKYFFIEKNSKRAAELKKLQDEFLDKKDDIHIKSEEANAYLQKFCRTVDWRARRAVLFLDPYGMQVEWETIKAIGATKSIDLWLLFPIGVAVNRMLPRDGQIFDVWRQKLDIMFGDPGWFDEFYEESTDRNLLGEQSELKKVANFNSIARYFVRRLETAFYGQVAQSPRYLYNSRNNPLYLLCFATGNATGAPIAIKIADHILKS